jgi:hypothetical protein
MKRKFLAWGMLALCLFPKNARCQSTSPSDAVALQQQGKWDEAISAWRAVTEKNPHNAGAFASL